MPLPVVETVEPASITILPGETKHVDVTASINRSAKTVNFNGYVRIEEDTDGPGTPVNWQVNVEGGLDPDIELEFGVYGNLPNALVSAGVSVQVNKTGPQSARYTFTRSA